MKLLTQAAVLVCDHMLGNVINLPTQDLVTISGHKVMVETEPAGRLILGCPNIGATIKPCLLTLPVEAGYSEWIRVEGKRVCLDTVTGQTDGTPPGSVKYKVVSPGQDLVSEVA